MYKLTNMFKYTITKKKKEKKWKAIDLIAKWLLRENVLECYGETRRQSSYDLRGLCGFYLF